MRSPDLAAEPGSDPAGGLSPEDRALLERLARWLVERRLTVPAVLFLESSKPMSFVGSQAMRFFEPMVKAVMSGQDYSRLAAILEERGNVDVFLGMVETMDDDARAAERAEKRRKKETKRKP